MDASLAGEGAECTLNGLYSSRGRQHVDNHTRIDHAAPHCTSRELYKGILDGAAHACSTARSSCGRARRRPTPARPTRTSLLSDRRSVDTKPQLEIFADDVKCAHGATVGQLDADSLVLPALRGLDEASARRMLTYAFAAEMLDSSAHRPARRSPSGWPIACCAARGVAGAGGESTVATKRARASARDRAATTSSACAATSRSCRAASTASRWSISTTPPPRQKPQPVIDADRATTTSDYNANIHRGVHYLSERATEALRGRARQGARASSTPRAREEIIFTRGTTEAINLVAQSYGRQHVGAGDEVLISAIEHHSNIVPWQMLCEENGARLRVVPINDRGELLARRVREAAQPAHEASSRSPTSRTRSARSTRCAR